MTGESRSTKPRDCLAGAELIGDALFGVGLDHALTGAAKATLASAAELTIPIVAIDVPSGGLGNTGENLGAVPAQLTQIQRRV